MSTPDLNHISFGGDDTGAIWMHHENDQSVLLFPGWTDPTNKFYREFIMDGDVIPEEGIADTLKISGVEYFRLIVKGRVVGGYEDCIDISHSHHIEVQVDTLDPQGKYAMTIKGGTSWVLISVGQLPRHGKETDFDFGNYANPPFDTQKTTDCAILVHNAIAYPRVRLLHAERISWAGETPFVVSQWMNGLFNPVYRCLKRLHLVS